MPSIDILSCECVQGMYDASLRIDSKATSKPAAEIMVEGELSPFEHEALYQLLRKRFSVQHPVYKELEDETTSTRVSLIFHHSYDREFFSEVFQSGWRELKDLFKQISYRRGRLGASFKLSFSEPNYRLTFSTGVLGDQELGSAMDQLGHLTGIVGRMMRPEMMSEPLERITASFDKTGDRWQDFRATDLAGRKVCLFDETLFRWKTIA